MIKAAKRAVVHFFAYTGLIALVGAVVYFLYLPEFFSREVFEESYSSFVSNESVSELVLVKLINTEIFEKHEYLRIFEKYPVGDTKVVVSVVATYFFLVKPDEIDFILEDETLFVHAGGLHLQTPVAFDSQSLSVSGEENWFGKNKTKLANEIQRDISDKLNLRGWLHRPVAKKQAYEALAKSVHEVFENLGLSGYYKEIVVTIADDELPGHQKFVFDDGFCNTLKCRYDIDIGDLIVELSRFKE
jgi:hypothetical protein